MSLSIASQFIGLISKGLTTIFDHKNGKVQAELKKRGIELDEKKLDIMLEVTEIEFQKYVLQNSLDIDKSFRGFVTEYEGAAKDVHPSVQILRGVIRPFITLWAVGIISFLMFKDPEIIKKVAENMKLIPGELWDIFYIVFGFWFGGRAAQHIIDRYAQGRTQERKEESRANVEVAIEKTKQEQIKVQGSQDTKPNTHFTQAELSGALARGQR